MILASRGMTTFQLLCRTVPRSGYQVYGRETRFLCGIQKGLLCFHLLFYATSVATDAHFGGVHLCSFGVKLLVIAGCQAVSKNKPNASATIFVFFLSTIAYSSRAKISPACCLYLCKRAVCSYSLRLRLLQRLHPLDRNF